MAKIIDPDDLKQSANPSDAAPDGNVFFDVATKEIELINSNILANVDLGTGSVPNLLTTEGISLQAVYSFTKEEWKDDAELIKYAFPFIAITSEQFELTNDWDFISNAGITQSQDESKNLLRDAGWALKDSTGDSLEEFMNVTSLGAFNDSGNDQAYYLQLDGGSPLSMVLPGEVNQAVKIYGNIGYGNYDYRTFFKVYLREQAKIYGFYDLIVEQNLTASTYRTYALPLANAVDTQISASDSHIPVGGTQADQAPYNGMSITYYQTPQDRGGLVGGTYSFNIIIDGNSATAEEIYEYVQWSLRQSFDIDSGTGVVRGDTAEELLEFIGDTLRTKSTAQGGVYIDNFNSADTNRVEFTDNTGSVVTFPFVAAGNIQFNDNLVNDADAKYWIFFTNTREISATDIGITQSGGFTGSIYTAGAASFAALNLNDYVNARGFTNTNNNGVYQITATPSATNIAVYKVDELDITTEVAGNLITLGENPFGSPDAIIIEDKDSIPIAGSVSAQSTVSFDFDYDGNVQGGRTAATDAKFTAVALGLNTGQYVITTGTIVRSTSNVINYVAALERNYLNP